MYKKIIVTAGVFMLALASSAQAASTIPLRDLTQGYSGAEVMQLQNFLAQVGHFTIAPTGYFGPVTKGALIAYQTKKDLPSTGYYGPLTRAVMSNDGAATQENGERVIVIFKSSTSESEQDAVLSKAGVEGARKLALVRGASVRASKEAVEKLRADSAVLRVDADVVVEAQVRGGADALRAAGGGAPAPAQVLPWGIDKIDAEQVWPTGNTASGVKVGIIDTGISKRHKDLTVVGGVNTISGSNFDDNNGHGSHVAGTVAAMNNTIGVVGAGPSVSLYAVKVLDANGSGFLSDVIEGIQWSVNNGMQVVNMSLGTTADVQSMHNAVIAAKAAGVIVVAAAGNNGGAVIFPAAYPEAIAVSATDQSDTITSWSSRGPEIDLAAPGLDIYSTYKGNGYATLSGTSMATPHVTGSAALVLSSNIGTYDANSNGTWDPDEVQKRLQDTAQDLGNPGFDNLYGHGRVNAKAAAGVQ